MEPGISVGVVLNYIAVHPVSPPPPLPLHKGSVGAVEETKHMNILELKAITRCVVLD